MTEEKAFINELQSDELRDEAFKRLVSEYKERLYWQIRNMVLNHYDADDILQNTFIKIYRNIKSFKGDSKIHTWMYRIAANEAITFLNAKAKHRKISLEDLKTETVLNLETDVYFEGNSFQLQFQKAIATLPERQRLIFTMKYFNDHTFEELSEIMNTSVGGLKSSYHIAVKKITDYIKTNEID